MSTESTLIFGYGHRARSGKDTAVAAIIKARNQDYDVRRYAFADILKQEVNAALDAFPAGQRHFSYLWDDDYYLVREDGVMVQLKDYPWVKYEADADMTDPLCPYGKQRTLLQWWGTEFRRNVNPDYWINRLADKLKKDQPEIALISDMRFPNEFAFVEERGETIRVDNPRLPPLPPSAHPSELALAAYPDERWTRVLKNDGTLEQFQQLAVEAFDTIMECYPKGYGLV